MPIMRKLAYEHDIIYMYTLKNVKWMTVANWTVKGGLFLASYLSSTLWPKQVGQYSIIFIVGFPFLNFTIHVYCNSCRAANWRQHSAEVYRWRTQIADHGMDRSPFDDCYPWIYGGDWWMMTQVYGVNNPAVTHNITATNIDSEVERAFLLEWMNERMGWAMQLSALL